MFAQINLSIAIFSLIIYLYFVPQFQNRRNLKNPSFTKIDEILIEYYKNYFTLFSSLRDFPKLKEVYEDIAFSLGEEGIDRNLLLEYSKRDKIKKTNWIISILSLLVSFMGAKELDKFLKVSKNIGDIYNKHKNDSLIKFLESFFTSDLWHMIVNVVLGSTITIICISLILFFIRVDSPKSIVNFGFTRHKTLIAEDLCNYFSSGFDQGVNHKLKDNLYYLNFSVLRTKEGYRIWIPRSFQVSGFKSNVALKNGDDNKIMVNKDGKHLTYHFSDIGEGWFLDVANVDNEEISGDDLSALKTVFEILFNYADLKAEKNRILRLLDRIAERIRKTDNKFYRVLKASGALIVLLICAVIFAYAVIFFIATGLIYLFLGSYLCWLISNWLLKNHF